MHDSGHYILDVSVENLKCFGKRQRITFTNENGMPERWSIILGDNGVGKTTLLKSIAAICPSPKDMFSLRREYEIRPGLFDWNKIWDTKRQNGIRDSRIESTFVLASNLKRVTKERIISLNISQKHSRFNHIEYNVEDYKMLGYLLCIAYGANRKMGNPTFSNDIFTTASISLFDDNAPLINVEEFFLRADYEAKTSKSIQSRLQRDKIKRLLITILPDVSDIRIRKPDNLNRSTEFKTHYGWVKLNEMSLGYKTLISWVVDFASRMFYYFPKSKNPFYEPAIVLVDEIDLHLHPKWQRKIMNYLSNIFRNTQFIATAHSPLIALEAANANLILLKRKGSEVVVENDPEIINTWRIDQLLTSDLFGLSSSRSISTENLISERRKILEKDIISEEDKNKLSELEGKLDFIPVAETEEYIEAMKIIHDSSKEIK